MIAIQVSERNGALIGAVLVDEHDEVMLISTGGVLIRTAVSQIREMGRSTQGVTLISLDAGEKLAGMERIEERDLGNGNGGNEKITRKFRRPRRPTHSPLMSRILISARGPRCFPRSISLAPATRCSTGARAACR